METIRILIVDDHPVVRHGLRMLLEGGCKWNVCGEADNGTEAVEQVRQLKPDIVIMDISMRGGMNGLDAIRSIRNTNPDVGVIVVTMHDSRQMFQEAMRAGAKAYVVKSDLEYDIIEALEAVSARKAFFSPGISHAVLESYVQTQSSNGAELGTPPVLTQRQLSVLRLLVQGKTNREVANALALSPRTVEAHRSQIMNRLRVRNMSELVRYAIRNNLVET